MLLSVTGEATAGKTAFKVDRYYYTEWLEADELSANLDGLSLDAVYENFVRQIAGMALGSDESATLKESVEQQKQREQLEKRLRLWKLKSEKKNSQERNLNL